MRETWTNDDHVYAWDQSFLSTSSIIFFYHLSLITTISGSPFSRGFLISASFQSHIIIISYSFRAMIFSYSMVLSGSFYRRWVQGAPNGFQDALGGLIWKSWRPRTTNSFPIRNLVLTSDQQKVSKMRKKTCTNVSLLCQAQPLLTLTHFHLLLLDTHSCLAADRAIMKSWQWKHTRSKNGVVASCHVPHHGVKGESFSCWFSFLGPVALWLRTTSILIHCSSLQFDILPIYCKYAALWFLEADRLQRADMKQSKKLGC